MKYSFFNLLFVVAFNVANAQITNENFENLPTGPITSSNQISTWSILSGYNGTVGAGSPTALTNYFPGGLSGQQFCNLLGCCPMPPATTELVDCSVGYIDPVIGNQYPVYSVFGTATVQGAWQANPHLVDGLKGNNVLRLNSANGGDYSITKIATTFSITQANSFHRFAFLPVFSVGHDCCNAGGFDVRVYDNGPAANGTPTTLTCYHYSLAASPSLCSTSQQMEYYKVHSNNKFSPQANDTLYGRWKLVGWDFTPYIGRYITIEFIVGDCTSGDHFSYVYLDTERKGLTLKLNGNDFNALTPTVNLTSCGAAQICGKNGMEPFSWAGPGIPPSFSTPSYTNSCIIATVSGNYTLTMNPEGACAPVTRVVNTTIQPGLFLAPQPNVFDLCQTNFVEISPVIYGTLTGSTFTWTGPPTASIVSAGGPTAQVNSAGLYTVTTSNSSNLCTSSTQVTVGICVGIEKNQVQSAWHIYPNPNNGVFHFSSDEGNRQTRVEVYTIVGKRVLVEDHEQTDIDIDISDQPGGVYLLRLESDHKSVFYKILKE